MEGNGRLSRTGNTHTPPQRRQRISDFMLLTQIYPVYQAGAVFAEDSLIDLYVMLCKRNRRFFPKQVQSSTVYDWVLENFYRMSSGFLSSFLPACSLPLSSPKQTQAFFISHNIESLAVLVKTQCHARLIEDYCKMPLLHRQHRASSTLLALRKPANQQSSVIRLFCHSVLASASHSYCCKHKNKYIVVPKDPQSILSLNATLCIALIGTLPFQYVNTSDVEASLRVYPLPMLTRVWPVLH